MKIMATWSLRPGASLSETIGRFLAGKAAPPEGIAMLGRWHSMDLSCGFTLYETSDAALMYGIATQWADLLEIRNFVVIDDSEAGPILAKNFAK